MYCPECTFEIPDDSKFCKECGYHLVGDLKTQNNKLITESERKYVTILFSDLSGYTAMTERLDPEEVKEIMSLIFGKITEIIRSYDGFIERFIGDAIMAVFGVPKAHEDDPVRAIRAALEIHAAADSFCPRFESKIGCRLTMHSGINTGLVVTGEVDVEKGTHGLTGDAINLASRLEGIAKAGEIIVGPDTYKQTANLFDFEAMEPTQVKGKEDTVNLYKLKSLKKKLAKTRRLHGVQAALTGRGKEMSLLEESIKLLMQGQGSVICIIGDAGTGKSRLKKEFRESNCSNSTQWFEGHCYSYTQDVPYYPLINLLSHAFQIDENDKPSTIRSKIELGVTSIHGKNSSYIPYIGSLFSLSYHDVQDVSPEHRKRMLHESIQTLISSLAKKGPTVICFEDIHWADTSFIQLLKRILFSSFDELLIICTYRSHFSLFNNDLPEHVENHYIEVYLKDLSTNDIFNMLKSLLGTRSLPDGLCEFAEQRSEGNPFYLEEMINSLIESKLLVHNRENWWLTKEINDVEIPSSIQGVLAARVDKLDKHPKRVLQEASVIGRSFLHKVLKAITEIDSDIDKLLSGLEGLDLIRTKATEPELEYLFKHALTQEVVYNGLLKMERQEIHERIGIAIEKLFHHRRQEFYEILSYHFKRGHSKIRAVEYLIRAGMKSFSLCSVEEAQKYYKEAYELLSNMVDSDRKEKILLIDLLNEWGFTLVWRGAYSELLDLFIKHEKLAESLKDKEKYSMFCCSIGIALLMRERLAESYTYLEKSLSIAEQINSKKAISHACFRLANVCANLGELDKAAIIGERAYLLSNDPAADLPLHRLTLSLTTVHWYRGDIEKLRQLGDDLLDKMKYNSDLRYLSTAKMSFGLSHLCSGDFDIAIQEFIEMSEVASDPMLIQAAKIYLGYAYLGAGQYENALSVSKEVMYFCKKFGFEFIGTATLAFQGFALAATGSLNEGLRLLEEAEIIWNDTNRLYPLAVSNCFYGQLYLRIVEGKGPNTLSFIIKNFRSIVKMVPGAAGKSEKHFIKAVEIARSIGAKGLHAQALMWLGVLYKTKGNEKKAKDNLLKATSIFSEINASGFLKTSNLVLDSLHY